MGLRNVLIAVLAVGIVVSAVVGLVHCPAPWLILTGYWTLGLIAILIERGRYRTMPVSPNFRPTPERFEDPVSGQTIRVYADPNTGQRDYRPAPDER